MHSVNVIAFHYLADKAHQVFFGLRMAGIEKIFPLVGYADCRLSFSNRFLSQSGDMPAVAQRDSYHPGMAFHASFMTFLNCEGKRVIAGVAACFACQYGIIRFDGRTVKYIPPGTGLEQHCVEVGSFQLIQNFDEFGLLFAYACGGSGTCAGPVQTINGSNPCGAYFMFGRLCGKRQQEDAI